jgi:23S rRNA G2445 N2-methylase RlmL
VKNRRDGAELEQALRARGFTPGVRDVEAVVDCLGKDDADLAREAERALARLGALAVPRLLVRTKDPEPRIRAGIYKTLGRLAPRGDAEAQRMIEGLDDEDPRVRRLAAGALGKLRGSPAITKIEDALFAAWDRDPRPEMERTIAASLGKLGSKRALGRLRATGASDPATARVARQATLTIVRDEARDSVSSIDAGRIAKRPVRIALRCRAGLERIVAEEARAWLGRVEKPTTYSGRVVADLESRLVDVFRIRTADSFAFVLPSVPLGTHPDEALVASLGSEAAKDLLETWTVGLVRYRVAWAGQGHRRGSTWRAAHALAGLRPAWVNDPTHSTWEVVAREEGNRLHVELSPRVDTPRTPGPRVLVDPRFAYRVRDVPAASHPPLAAALVRVAEVRSDDCVWDPFMGSGVELVERSLAGPYARLVGTDTDRRALDAARANFAAAHLANVGIECADATMYKPQRTTLILTNPPMGRRLANDGSLGPLLDRFIDHVADVLAPGGRLVWLSPLGARTGARARTHGLAVELEEEIDMGGFRARLQRIVRRCAPRENVQT